MRRRGFSGWTAALLAAVMAVSCGTAAFAAETEGGTEASTEAYTGEVQEVTFATEGHTALEEYVDEDGKLTGYEVEVMEAVDDLLPQYHFNYDVTEFESIFNGIDAGRYIGGFNCLSWNKDRAEKYIFPKHYIRYEASGIYVRKGLLDEHPINSLDDLGGLTTACNAKGDAWQLFLENFNEEHPDNPIKINYADSDWATFYLQLYQGQIDFMMGGESSLQVYKDEYGYDFDFVSLPEEEAEKLQNPSSWVIFAKTDEGQKLADAYDGAMEKLRDNGTLTKLSEKYWGKDYSGSDREDW